VICVSRARASSLLPRLPLSIPLCTLMVCLCEAPFALRRVSSVSLPARHAPDLEIAPQCLRSDASGSALRR